MHDLLSPDEDKVAAAQGWGLHHVYDLDIAKWHVMVIGGSDSNRTLQAIANQAKMGSALHQKALNFVINSQQGK